jgi:FO synthase
MCVAGGISPITRDYVNPEKSWPHLEALAAATAASGKLLLPRLPVYPHYILDLSHVDSSSSSSSDSSSSSREPWLSRESGPRSVAAAVLRASDGSGLLRGSSWVAGKPQEQQQQTPAAAAAAEGGHSLSNLALESAQQHEDQQQQSPQQQALIKQLQEPVEAVQRELSNSHQQQQQQQQLASIPLPRKRASRLWQISLNSLGVLEGMTYPQQASLQVQQLLDEVLSSAAAAGSTAVQQPGATTGSHTSSRIEPSSSCRQWTLAEVELLLSCRGADMAAVVAAADALRAVVCGDDVSYVVNRNINYTNVCTYGCKFCAFSKVSRQGAAV